MTTTAPDRGMNSDEFDSVIVDLARRRVRAQLDTLTSEVNTAELDRRARVRLAAQWRALAREPRFAEYKDLLPAGPATARHGSLAPPVP